MKPELAEYLGRETAAFVLLAVTREGEIYGASAEVPLAVSMMAAKHAELAPADVLAAIRVVGVLGQMQGEPKPARGRKPGKAPKPAPAPAEKQPKPEAAQAV